MVVSLLHPSPEIFDLFDNVVVLTDGRVIYEYVAGNMLRCINLIGIMDECMFFWCSGPVREAVPFFQGLGFHCPPRVEAGSFLQEITTPQGQMEFASADLLARNMRGGDHRCDALAGGAAEDLLVSVNDMVEALKYSEFGESIDADLEQSRSGRSNVCPRMPHKKFAREPVVLSFLVFRRHLTLMNRERLFIASRMTNATVSGLFLGLFFSSVALTGDPDPQEVLAQGRKTTALIAAACGFMTFAPMPLIASTYIRKPILLKQRDQHIFPPLSYILAQTMEDMLVCMLEAALFSVSLYWISGLTKRPVNFFVFVMTTWSCMLSSATMFRSVAYIFSNQGVAMKFSSFLIVVWLITNGFSILSSSIPGWLTWVYYGINPMAYTLRALCINELTSSAWGPAGYLVLDLFAILTDQIWIWISLAYNLGLVLICMLSSAMALHYVHPCQGYTSIHTGQKRKGSVNIGRAKTVGRKLLNFDLRKIGKEQGSHSSGVGTPLGQERAARCQTTVDGIEVEPLTIICKGLTYYVQNKSGGSHREIVRGSGDKAVEGKIRLLRNIDFFAQPGHLTALMGGSGAGKTSLMDVLAGRKTQGVIQGDILVNGREMSGRVRSRAIGYVEQVDLHSPWITVRETLYFAARLRLPEAEVSPRQASSIVNEALRKVELQPQADSVVGEPGGRGLPTHHRKRLSIGVELVGNLPVILMVGHATYCQAHEKTK